MSISGTSVELVRKHLDQITLSRIKEEAGKYGIKLNTEEHSRWSDAIIDHLVRESPLGWSQDATGEANLPGSSAAGNASYMDTASDISLFDAGSRFPQQASKAEPQSFMFLRRNAHAKGADDPVSSYDAATTDNDASIVHVFIHRQRSCEEADNSFFS